jgi:antitoxin component YwqK of YwqJK toxin-antitoxin module
MKYILSLLLLIFSLNSFAQTDKAYINIDGKFTSDPKKAVGYLLVTKLSDSAFAMKEYDINNTIKATGTYKDLSLKTANGKFTYYQKDNFVTDGNTVLNTDLDTRNYAKTVGYFLNGKRTGIWVDFSAKGIKSVEYTYDNDKLNGLYKTYNSENSWSEGTMTDGQLQGKYYTYLDSMLVTEYDYHNGKIVHTINHLQGGTVSTDFERYLAKQLSSHRYLFSQVPPPIVKFTIKKDGSIINPGIAKGISPAIDSAILSTISTAPKCVPAILDGKPTDLQIDFVLTIFKTYSVISTPSITQSVIKTRTISTGGYSSERSGAQR